MRIAIIGSAGTGKTTLSHMLAEKIGVPLVPEFAREILAEWGFKRLRDLDAPQMANFQREILQRKLYLEARYDSFVSDRSTADSAVYWLLRLVGRVASDETSYHMEKCRIALDRYDALVLLPWKGNAIERDGIRDTDPWQQFLFEIALRGLLAVWEREYYLVRCTTHHERLAEITERVYKNSMQR